MLARPMNGKETHARRATGAVCSGGNSGSASFRLARRIEAIGSTGYLSTVTWSHVLMRKHTQGEESKRPS